MAAQNLNFASTFSRVGVFSAKWLKISDKNKIVGQFADSPKFMASARWLRRH